MSDFRETCKQAQSNFQEHSSVKRCPEISPSSRPHVKQARTEKVTAAKKLFSSTSDTSSSSSQSEVTINSSADSKFISVHYIPIIAPKPSHSRPEAGQSFKSEMTILFLSDSQQQKIVRAANTKQASAVAHIIKEHCPNVLSEIKKAIVNDINSSCQSLCKRTNGTYLYGSRSIYTNMSEFQFQKIWDEVKTTNPFLIDVLNAVSGGKCSPDETKSDLQIKYSFIYSILMSVRWHELTLVQRVNTVLMIEGGCTKQVQYVKHKVQCCVIVMAPNS